MKKSLHIDQLESIASVIKIFNFCSGKIKIAIDAEVVTQKIWVCSAIDALIGGTGLLLTLEKMFLMIIGVFINKRYGKSCWFAKKTIYKTFHLQKVQGISYQ